MREFSASTPPVIPALDGTLILGMGLQRSRHKLMQRQQVPFARLRGRPAVRVGVAGLAIELPWPLRMDDSPEPDAGHTPSAAPENTRVPVTSDQQVPIASPAHGWPVPIFEAALRTDPPAPAQPEPLPARETPPPVVIPPTESAPPAAPPVSHERSIVRQMERVVATLIERARPADPPDLPRLIERELTSLPDPLSTRGEGEKAAAGVPVPIVEWGLRGEINLPMRDRAVPDGDSLSLPELSWRETPPIDPPRAERLPSEEPPAAWIEPPALLPHPPLTLLTEVIEHIVREEVRTEVQRQQIEQARPNRQDAPDEPGRSSEQTPADVRPAVVTDDETVRALMVKMNAMAREDRFRRGLLR